MRKTLLSGIPASRMLALNCLVLVVLSFACAQPPAADLVFKSAEVWSGAEGVEGDAIAVRDGRIVAIGTNVAVSQFIGDDTQVIDLDGAFVVPGFNDNHVHFGSAARFLDFNLMKVGSQDELRERVVDVLSRVSEGEWITGGLWGAYDQWVAGSAGNQQRTPFSPDLRQLDELTAQHPMFLRKFDGSQFAANRAALVAAGLDPDEPVLTGVVFERNGDGRLTGVMVGDDIAATFEAVIPPLSRERRMAQSRHALEEIARAGVTNVSDMSDDEQLEIYRELHANGELTVRVHFRYPLDRFSELAQQDIRIGSGDPWIRLGSLKGHIDGIMGNSTARFYRDYDHAPGNRGRWRRLMVDESGDFAEGQFLQYMLDADRADLQLSIHAIGDEANGLLMDYLEQLRAENGLKDRRFRLVHAQVVAQPDMPRLGAQQVIAEVQPFHLSDDMRWMEERIGAERSLGAYAFRSILDSGAVLSFGSDWPGTAAAEYPINPMLGLYAAVTRKTLSGEPKDGWFAKERIAMEEALRAYTWGSAYANFEDAEKGTLEVGKLADITVLDQNLLVVEPEQVLDTQVLFTVVDGRIVYASDSEY